MLDAGPGLAFAMVPAVLWPSVTYLVAEERLGSAYALMTFAQQLGWAAMSWGLGLANDVSKASAENPTGWLLALWMLARSRPSASSSRSCSGARSGMRPVTVSTR